MRIKYYLLCLFCLLAKTNLYSQDSINKPSNDNSNTKVTISFGGVTQGEISINDHLKDSLMFTNSIFNPMLRINSFHMTVTCKGQIIKSLENKSGCKLTDEMKVALKKAYSGCSIIFGSIKLISTEKDVQDKYNIMDYGSSLKLIQK